MIRNSASIRKTFGAAIASSLVAMLGGCSHGSGSGASAVAPMSLSIPENPRDAAPATQPSARASANAAGDLAGAQSEDVISHAGSSRDIDLGGNTQNGQPLTYQSLGDALRQIGITPEDDKTAYSMKVKATTADQTDWTFVIAASLSKDQSVIWITASLCQIDQNGTPSAQALMDLLTANGQMGLSFFVLDPQHTLVLQQPLANTNITPQMLGADLKSFFDCLKATEPLWKMFYKSGGGDSQGGTNPFQ